MGVNNTDICVQPEQLAIISNLASSYVINPFFQSGIAYCGVSLLRVVGSGSQGHGGHLMEGSGTEQT